MLFLLVITTLTSAAPGASAASVRPEWLDDPLLLTGPAEITIDTWDEAFTRLQQRSTDLQIARSQVLRAEAEARRAWAPLLPSVGASLTLQQDLIGGRRNVLIGGENIEVDEVQEARPTSPTGALRATASLTLVDVPAWYALSAANARERAERAEALETWRILLRSLSGALLSSVTAERIVELDRAGVLAALERHRLTQEAERLGSGRQLDVLRTERDLQSARSALLASVESLRRTRELLGQSLGAGATVGVSSSFKLDTLAATLQQLCKPLFGAPRRDLIAAETRLEASRRELTAARTEYAPTLAAQSSLTALTVDPGFARVNRWDIGAVLSFDLWDGGVREADVRSRRADVALAQAELEVRRRAWDVELSQARRGVTVAASQLDAAARARDAAVKTDELTKIAFREGVGTSLELVQSGVELRAAQRDFALRQLELVERRIEALMVEAECALE